MLILCNFDRFYARYIRKFVASKVCPTDFAHTYQRCFLLYRVYHIKTTQLTHTFWARFSHDTSVKVSCKMSSVQYEQNYFFFLLSACSSFTSSVEHFFSSLLTQHFLNYWPRRWKRQCYVDRLLVQKPRPRVVVKPSEVFKEQLNMCPETLNWLLSW